MATGQTKIDCWSGYQPRQRTAATTEDKNGGQVGSRQIGRSENGSKERMANSRGRPLCLPCSRGERRFALNSHDKDGSE
ncbi:MAG: hypothetical protein RRB24_09910 [Armatimonadota bacterium]|nr:hypothetical protein [Armatimonadota bacterium]MDT7973129.1 hypothetical protein [Armatimonadota bacterium]